MVDRHLNSDYVGRKRAVMTRNGPKEPTRLSEIFITLIWWQLEMYTPIGNLLTCTAYTFHFFKYLDLKKIVLKN